MNASELTPPDVGRRWLRSAANPRWIVVTNASTDDGSGGVVSTGRPLRASVNHGSPGCIYFVQCTV